MKETKVEVINVNKMITQSKEQIAEVKKELKKSATKMGKKQRRTELARIEVGWLRVIRNEGRERKITISGLLDDICVSYFGIKAYKKQNGKNPNN